MTSQLGSVVGPRSIIYNFVNVCPVITQVLIQKTGFNATVAWQKLLQLTALSRSTIVMQSKFWWSLHYALLCIVMRVISHVHVPIIGPKLAFNSKLTEKRNTVLWQHFWRTKKLAAFASLAVLSPFLECYTIFWMMTIYSNTLHWSGITPILTLLLIWTLLPNLTFWR